jgi:predicted TIM-barrel fold metal-dependent hydrolase
VPRAIDFHVHLPTTEFMQVTLGPYAKAAERFFRTEVKLRDIEQIAADYAELDMLGVLLAWDAETATGLPPLGNDYIARIVERYPQQFIGFASVDPHKGKAAVKEMDYTRPIYLDSLAADFPALTIIGAHPSWPWHEEMIASMQHKTNIFNDLSGWSHPPFNLQISIARSSGPSPKHQAAYRLRPLFTSASAFCTKSMASWSVVPPSC